MGVRAVPAFDLLVHGGTVVRAEGSLRADVAIRDGRIVAVDGSIPADAATDAIDATGLLVLPGVIDVHTHTRIGTDEEPDRFFQDTVAAAFGGTTTVLAFNNPGTGISEGVQGSLIAGVREWMERTSGDAAVDVGLSAVITAQQHDPVADLPAIAELGVASGKCFLVYDFGIDEELLGRVLQGAARANILLEVHGEDRALLDSGIAGQLAAGETGPLGHARSRPPACEAAGTARAIAIAARGRCPGLLRACLVRRSGRPHRAAPAVAGSACSPKPVRITCRWMLRVTNDRSRTPWGRSSRRLFDPSRTRMPSGTPSVSATWTWSRRTMCPTGLAVEKRYTGQPFTEVSNGAPGIETLLAVTYASGVAAGADHHRADGRPAVHDPGPAVRDAGQGCHRGRAGTRTSCCSTRQRPHVIRQADLHHTSDFTPYEGMAVPGSVRTVLVRGRHVIRDGAFVGDRGQGRYVARSGG